MILKTTIKEMQELSNALIAEGKTISFVPTMGALHEAHLALVKKALSIADICVVSIFVNPLQFGKNEDLDKYPIKISKDMEILDSMGVDVVFTPNMNEMYPSGFQTQVEVEELQKPLCGAFRPGHFRGVATVVLKLLNIVKPHSAIFGEKDFQQLQVIKQMVGDLAMDVEIIGYPLVRENDGLAMSSRNVYLTSSERSNAVGIFKALSAVKSRFDSGQKDSEELITVGKQVLHRHELENVEYFQICDSSTLKIKESAESGDTIAVALRLGNTRLIDNMRL